jgi:hypothetical protein
MSLPSSWPPTKSRHLRTPSSRRRSPTRSRPERASPAGEAFDSFVHTASPRERRQADLFFSDLSGWSLDAGPWLQPPTTEAEAEAIWSHAIATLPQRYQVAYRHAQLAELELDAETVDALTLDLLMVRDQGELEAFLGKFGRTISRSVSKTARAVGKVASDVGKGVATVATAVAPLVASAAKFANHAVPMGMLARATYGAIAAGLSGKNILGGAVDGLAGTPLVRGLVRAGGGILRGENVVAAVKLAGKAGIEDTREAIRFVAMVAPFVPGIGTGVGAALGAADALANGKPITEALIAGVRGSIPGGPAAQAAFETGTQLIQGKRLDQALLTAARNRLPPGPAQAAFDTAVALAQGKKLQEAMIQGVGRLLPPFQYSADVADFARRALAGDNLGNAALTATGNAVLRRAKLQGADIVATAQGRVQGVIAPVVAAGKPRAVASLDQMIVAAGRDNRRQADRFLTDLVGGRRAAPQGAGVVATAQGRVQRATAPVVVAVKPPAVVGLEQMIVAADRANRTEADRFLSDLTG